MEITNITIQKEEKENSRMIGYAEIVFDEFVAKKNISDGKYKDYVHPINEEFRRKIDEAIKEAYEKEK